MNNREGPSSERPGSYSRKPGVTRIEALISLPQHARHAVINRLGLVAVWALVSLVAVALVVWAVPLALNSGEEYAIVMYKNSGCRCCDKWADYLEANGFFVSVRDRRDVSIGVPAVLRACHTALIDGYIVEGHVPAGVVRKLLSERPDVRGIAVPGMPRGSPGMEGGRGEPYDVLTFGVNDEIRVFARIR